ncbi:uncharacterized protein PV09_05819 [Verruconis gallopava]|uniref:FAD-binding domain-containing protein n=1 Tax=Verruconis gallopava TaxID=253628 RepID=A0A0D1YQ65_9PEZI|nr:uncharacterized protein PV09_05819 [Verruconis gallopava]KIW02747.1 hypothetical protein PV09_05819 [Verruconis gallopava]
MLPPSEFSQPPSKRFNVAVVGGGLGGLILTFSLLSQRVPVTLYEAASNFGEIGAGVSIGPNASRALKLISPHLYAAFESRATRNQSKDHANIWFDFRYGEDCGGKRNVSEKITSLYCEGGQASVHRAHFLDELVRLLPSGVAKFGHRAQSFTDEGTNGVLIHFHNGVTARHDAVVGCDGIKSKIRPSLLGHGHPAAYAVYSGKYAYRGLVSMEKAREVLGEELSGNAQMYFGRHGHVLTFAIEKGRTMNVVAFSSSGSWDHDDWVVTLTREEMDKDFAHWGDKVRSILALMSKTDVWALFNHPEAPTFYKGRAALLGDAAHASTPHMGSGAGMAIEDAFILGNLLGTIDDSAHIEKTFKAYDAVRRTRGTDLVQKSSEQGRLYDLELVGDDPERLKDELGKRMQWVWNFDITKDLEKAKQMLRDL